MNKNEKENDTRKRLMTGVTSRLRKKRNRNSMA